MAHPCRGSRASVLRIRRSSVPCGRPACAIGVIGTTSYPLYFDKEVIAAHVEVQRESTRGRRVQPASTGRYFTFAATVAFALSVNVQVFTLLPPLEQAPDQTVSRPFVALSVIDVPALNDAEPVVPTLTLMPCGSRSDPLAAPSRRGHRQRRRPRRRRRRGVVHRHAHCCRRASDCSPRQRRAPSANAMRWPHRWCSTTPNTATRCRSRAARRRRRSRRA